MVTNMAVQGFVSFNMISVLSYTTALNKLIAYFTVVLTFSEPVC